MPNMKLIARRLNPFKNYLPREPIVYVNPIDELPESNWARIGDKLPPMLAVFVTSFLKKRFLSLEVKWIKPRAYAREADLPINMPVLDLSPLDSFWFSIKGNIWGLIRVTVIGRIY